jgi:hypothetical protein
MTAASPDFGYRAPLSNSKARFSTLEPVEIAVQRASDEFDRPLTTEPQ